MIEALSNKPFKIYQSSAGSGKTYTLVKEYISIVLKSELPHKFKQVLAITFTNKAANEMKERVLEALWKLSKNEDANLMKDYVGSTGLNEQAIIKKSGETYKNILHQYGDFNILTIDKFVHRIIRSFARELDLNINFEVESDIDTFLQRSIGLLLSNVGTDEELTKYLIRFSEQLVEESDKGDIERQLLKLTSILKNEKDRIPLTEFKNHDLAFFSELGEKVKNNEKKLNEEVKIVVSDLLELLAKESLNATFFKGNGKSGWGGMLNKYVEKNEFDLTEATIKQYHESTWFKASDENLISGVKDALLVKMKRLIELFEEAGFISEFKKQLVGFSLLNSIHQILYKVKTDNNIVFISDFNEIISKIVQSEPAPFVYEKIGARYKNYLIDEFQDTSNLQWNNLIPLVYDSLSEGNENLIVGDAKQAIYRWRDGNVQQFVDLPKVKGDFSYLNEINTIFEYSAIRKNLTNNYRSTSAVIQFNNWLFTALAGDENEKVKQIYTGSEQSEIKKDVGFVNVKVLDKDAVNISELFLENVLEYISQAKKDGYLNGDIAVLVRSNSDGMKVAEFLKENQFPVVSTDSIVLGSSKEVAFIVSFLQAFEDVENEHAAIKCIDYLKEETSLTNVYDVWRIPKKDDPEYSVGIDFNKYLHECHPAFIANHYLSLNLYDKVVHLIQSFQLNRYDPYIDQLLNTIHHYLQRNNSNINQFVEFYEKKKEKIAVNLGSVNNAIQVMTIHKSKGLQFPVVIVPFAKWKNTSGNAKLTWIEHEKLVDLNLPKYVSPLTTKSLKNYSLDQMAKEEDEEAILDNINTYYVAFTRAVDRLYVTASDKKIGVKDVTSKIIEKIKAHPEFDEQKGELKLGELNKNVSSNKEISAEIKGATLVSKREQLNLSLDRNAYTEDLTQVSDREIGIAVHTLLSQMNGENTVEEIAAKLVKSGGLKLEKREEVIKLVKRLFELDQVKDWFKTDSEVFNEKEIISENGSFYRPDKVIVNKEKAVVIDFKTGKEQKKHSLQITEYGNLLTDMGYTQVEKYLLYVNEPKIVIV